MGVRQSDAHPTTGRNGSNGAATPAAVTLVKCCRLYEGARRQVIHRLDQPSHGEVSPTAATLPRSWRRARAFYLAPMPFDVQRELALDLSRIPGALVALDPYRISPEASARRGARIWSNAGTSTEAAFQTASGSTTS